MATTGHEFETRLHEEQKLKTIARNKGKKEVRPMWHSALCEHTVLPFRYNIIEYVRWFRSETKNTWRFYIVLGFDTHF